jgi:hypothetical protein
MSISHRRNSDRVVTTVICRFGGRESVEDGVFVNDVIQRIQCSIFLERASVVTVVVEEGSPAVCTGVTRLSENSSAKKASAMPREAVEADSVR